MRNDIGFRSDNTLEAPISFGQDESGFNYINIYGKWTSIDFNRDYPSCLLAKIDEVSCIRLTTSEERESFLFVDKVKNSVHKNYIKEVGAYIKTTESNMLFLASSLRENSVIEINLVIEDDLVKIEKLTEAINDYMGKNKTVKVEVPIVGFDIQSTRRLTETGDKMKIEASVLLGAEDEEDEVHGKPNCGDLGRG